MLRFFSENRTATAIKNGATTAIKYATGNVVAAIGSFMFVNASENKPVLDERSSLMATMYGLFIAPITFIINGVQIQNIEKAARAWGIPEFVNPPAQSLSTLNQYRLGGGLGTMSVTFLAALPFKTALSAFVGSIAGIPVGVAIVGPGFYLYKTSQKIRKAQEAVIQAQENASDDAKMSSDFQQLADTSDLGLVQLIVSSRSTPLSSSTPTVSTTVSESKDTSEFAASPDISSRSQDRSTSITLPFGREVNDSGSSTSQSALLAYAFIPGQSTSTPSSETVLSTPQESKSSRWF